jgi:hypothetical protein
MPEDKNGPSGFKVVDRRTFGSDGTRREEPTASEKKPTPPSVTPSRATSDEAERPASPEEYSTGFDTLVSYLSTTALFQLGLLPGPGGERIPVDLGNARRTIDLLEVLREKTQGNLTPEENRMLDDVLYELRVSFIEVEKYRAREGK